MKRRWSTLVVAMMLGITVLIIQAMPAAAQPAKTYKVGYIGGLTGPLAFQALPALAGTKYAIEEANKAGGFQGRQVEIISKDGKERPDVSLSEARNLVMSDGVNVLLGGASAPVVMALSAFAKEHKIIYIPYPSGTMVWGKEGHRYVFKFNGNADNFGYATAEYLAEKPFKNYYTIASDHLFGHDTINYAWKRLSEKKPDVKKVGEFWPKFGERDYVNYITSIMAARPDAVLALLSGSNAIDFVRQAKNVGFFKNIRFANTLFITTDVVAMGKEMPDGIIGTSEYDMEYCPEKYPLAKKLQQRYDQDYKDLNYANVATGYNATLFLVSAVKKAGSTDTEKIVDALEGLEIDTALGKMKCLPYSHRAIPPAFVGVTKMTSKYPFATITDLKVYPAEKIMVSEDEVRKMRGQ
jgi:branched-chain amino acid transport system substrate-binding protein